MKTKFFTIIALTSYFFLIPTNALAQTSVGLSAIPPRIEITGEPGQLVTKEIKVRNESSAQKTITTNSRDFIVVDDKGTPLQLDDENSKDNRWAASNWIQVSPSKLTLKPGETRSLVLTLIVPEDALPGGRYAMILHTPNNELTIDQTGASVQTNVGTLVYITVPGDIKQDATVTKFTAPFFSEYGPVNFKATIANFSDIHITPIGTITIKNWFGGQTSKLSLSETNIFPYTTRDFSSTLERKWLFGRYTAQLEAAYGTAGQVASAAIIFWVIPWRLILMVIATIIIVTTLFIVVSKRKPTKTNSQSAQIDDLEKELEALKKKYQDK